jgi:hypothetical protein
MAIQGKVHVMRKLLLTVLLAGAAASPTLAQSQPDDQRAARQQARAERQAARDEARPQPRSEARPSRSFGGGDYARPSRPTDFARPAAPAYQPRPDNSFVRSQAPNAAGGGYDWRNQQRDQARDNRVLEQQQRQQAIRDRVQQRQDLRQARVPPVINRRPPVISPTPQPGTQPPAPTTTRYTPRPSWTTSWRNNSRYDWQNYRNRHRSLFHLGFYYDPFGWGYQRYDIGWRMWPGYFGSSFWINDPWYYRLPYAPPGTRWVRYYDDAVLVDTWSGEVVDVIYNFFW